VKAEPLWHEAQFCWRKTRSPASAAVVIVPSVLRFGLLDSAVKEVIP